MGRSRTEETRMNLRSLFVSTLALLLLMASGAMASPPPAPKIQVELLAEHTALVPGTSTGLAIAFKIESGWHIYWHNHGEGGMPPEFEWQLPPGYQVGPMRFPAPQRHVDHEADLHTFILEGEPVILTQLTVPTSAQPGEKVTLGVKVRWLACKEVCVQGNKTLSIQLPVIADQGQAETADPVTFKMAQRSLPAPAEKAKYLKSLEAVASVDKVRPGDKFEVGVIFEVQPGHHINSNTPLSKELIPTDLFHAHTPGLDIGRPRFPPGQIEEQAPPEGLSLAERLRTPAEKLSVYRGKTVVVLPVEASGSLAGDSVQISGVVTYQACRDAAPGMPAACFPPTAAEWSLTLPVAKPGEEVQVVKLPGADAAAGEPAVASGSPTTRPGQDTDDQGSEGPVAATTAQEPPTDGLAMGVVGRITGYMTSLGVLGYLGLAFIGGLVMNLMPCVLPVISIKILSFVQQARESRLRVLTLGLSFSAGIVVSFIVLGLLILGLLKGLGLELEWGGQYQKPVLLIAFSAVVTALALSLFGVFTLSPPRFVLDMGGRVEAEGHVNAFAMGLLATILGTACTAPFISLVIAWALRQPPAIGMLVFVLAGFGMALPYILLAAHPAWLRFVPRPGPWMETFEHVMGFLLLGTVAYFLHALGIQLGAQGLLWTIVFLLFVAAGMWCYGRAGFGSSPRRQAVCYTGTVLLIAGGWWWCFGYMNRIPELAAQQHALVKTMGQLAEVEWTDSESIPWIPYSRAKMLELVNAGKTVFIDYTAEWCVNCKYNEKVVINTPAVREAMRRLGVVPIRADYTLEDPEIKADLERFKRAGVPMYVVVPANRPDEPILLNEILTQRAVIEALNRAGPSDGASVSVVAKEQ